MGSSTDEGTSTLESQYASEREISGHPDIVQKSIMLHNEPKSALHVIFENVSIQDDARTVNAHCAALLPSYSCEYALIVSPDSYGAFVRRIAITDPLVFTPVDGVSTASTGDEPGSPAVSTGDFEDDPPNRIRPIPAKYLEDTLRACVNLEEFSWQSSTPPPDGICEVLGMHCPKLSSFLFNPPNPFLAESSPVVKSGPSQLRWDSPSLPHLSTLQLSRLFLSRLTQVGARNLLSFISNTADFSHLEEVQLDFLWLDDALCEELSRSAKKLKRLRLGTSGTKLTDRGILAVLENCDTLEEFELYEVQGRLSRALWTKVEDLPLKLRSLKISMSAEGPHHSWTAEHLQSLHSLPFSMSSISTLAISRTINPFDTSGVIDEVATLKPIPQELLEKLKGEGTGITRLECDWWAWTPLELKEVLEECPELEEIRITLNAPFSKLFNLANIFANMLRLKKIGVVIPETVAPSITTVASRATSRKSNQHGAQTPGSSPIAALVSLPTPSVTGDNKTPNKRQNSSSPVTNVVDLATQPPTSQAQGPPSPQTGLNLTSPNKIPPLSFNMHTIQDSHIPALRDVLKFARRCPKLESIEWYGRNGRGMWIISRENGTSSSAPSGQSATTHSSGSATASTGTSTIKVDHVAPSLATPAERARLEREEDAIANGWTPIVPRAGQEWMGRGAKAYELPLLEETQKLTHEKESKASQGPSSISPQAEAVSLPGTNTVPPTRPSKSRKPSVVGKAEPPTQSSRRKPSISNTATLKPNALGLSATAPTTTKSDSRRSSQPLSSPPAQLSKPSSDPANIQGPIQSGQSRSKARKAGSKGPSGSGGKGNAAPATKRYYKSDVRINGDTSSMHASGPDGGSPPLAVPKKGYNAPGRRRASNSTSQGARDEKGASGRLRDSGSVVV